MSVLEDEGRVVSAEPCLGVVLRECPVALVVWQEGADFPLYGSALLRSRDDDVSEDRPWPYPLARVLPQAPPNEFSSSNRRFANELIPSSIQETLTGVAQDLCLRSKPAHEVERPRGLPLRECLPCAYLCEEALSPPARRDVHLAPTRRRAGGSPS